MNRRGPLIAAAVGIVLTFVMAVALIMPKAGAVRAKQEEVEQARQEQVTLSNQIALLKDDKARAGKARKRLAKLQSQIPLTADLPGLIRLLNTTAAQSDVDFISVAPGTPAPAVSGKVSIVPMQISLVGGFFAVDEYLVLLEELPRVSKTMAIQVNPGPDGLPQLQVDLSVEFYTTDLSVGPGSVPGPSETVGDPTKPGTGAGSASTKPAPSPTSGG